jgi:ABC-type lipoprotein export system ATPase subunit
MVLVTHDSSVARQAERVAIMKDGRLSIKQDRLCCRTLSGHGL